jgi:hypothetical protein
VIGLFVVDHPADDAAENLRLVGALHRTRLGFARDEGGAEASRAMFEQHVEGLQGVVVVGHGGPTALVTKSGQPLLDRSNVSVIRGRWLHAFACRTGQILADAAVVDGAEAYAGYSCPLFVDAVTEAHLARLGEPFECLLTETSACLAEGVRDARVIQQRLSALVDEIELDDADFMTVGILADQLLSRLILRRVVL